MCILYSIILTIRFFIAIFSRLNDGKLLRTFPSDFRVFIFFFFFFWGGIFCSSGLDIFLLFSFLHVYEARRTNKTKGEEDKTIQQPNQQRRESERIYKNKMNLKGEKRDKRWRACHRAHAMHKFTHYARLFPANCHYIYLFIVFYYYSSSPFASSSSSVLFFCCSSSFSLLYI